MELFHHHSNARGNNIITSAEAVDSVRESLSHLSLNQQEFPNNNRGQGEEKTVLKWNISTVQYNKLSIHLYSNSKVSNISIKSAVEDEDRDCVKQVDRKDKS